MRLLFLSQYFWPEDFRSNDIVRGLRDRGFKVTIVTGLPNYPQGRFFKGYGIFRGPFRETWEGFDVTRIPHLERGKGSGIRLALNYISFAIMGALVLRFQRNLDYDAVLCWMPSPVTQVVPAIVAKHRAGAPLILWVMDLWPDSLFASGRMRNRALVRAAGLLTRWVYRRCDLIIGQSRRFAEHIAGVAGLPAEQVEYVPQWELQAAVGDVNTVAIPPIPAGFRVLFTGNTGYSQDLGVMLEAARILKSEHPIQWIVVGDGQALLALKRRSTELGVDDVVHFMGRFPPEIMPAFHAQADALLATLRPEEIFSRTIPTKIQSYLASGLPLVTAIDGEVADMIAQSGAGASAPAGDARGLADAVLGLARSDVESRREMGRKGKAYYDANFRRDVLLDRLAKLIRDAAADKCSTGRKSGVASHQNRPTSHEL